MLVNKIARFLFSLNKTFSRKKGKLKEIERKGNKGEEKEENAILGKLKTKSST